MNLNTLEKRLLNEFQRNFPLAKKPYAEIAMKLGVDENLVLQILEKLQSMGLISRSGAVFEPHRIGTSTLASITVPESELRVVADIVSSFIEVNHNYEREHKINLWFVVTARDDKHLQKVIREIEEQTGYEVMRLPMLENYHIDLGFDLKWT